MAERNYRTKLRDEFEARKARNPKYSLRAFARDIALAPSQLSDFFAEKKGLSFENAALIAARLKMSEEEIKIFCTEVEADHGRSLKKRMNSQIKINKIRAARGDVVLDLDMCEVLSEWYYSALLELIRIPGQSHEIPKLAKRLGINNELVATALTRLLRINLIQKKDGYYVREDSSITSPLGVTNEAKLRWHQNFLEKSMEALFENGKEDKDFKTYTFAYSQSDLPAIQEEIRVFVQDLTKRYVRKDNIDNVGYLATQMVSLCKVKEEK